MNKRLIIFILAASILGTAVHYKVTNIKLKNEVKQLQAQKEKCERDYKVLNINYLQLEEAYNEQFKIRESNDIEIERLKIEIEELKKKLNNQGTEITVELTGYCNCHSCTQSGEGITASGTVAKVGTIATPSEIPLGSTLYIPSLISYKSDGLFYAEDRGEAIVQKSNGVYVIDVWFPSHQQALEFGRKTATAYIK